MNINWQDIYYAAATVTMVVVTIVFVWLLRILYSISKILSNLVHSTQKLGNGVSDIRNLNKNITLGILRKIVTVLDKGGEYEQQ